MVCFGVFTVSSRLNYGPAAWGNAFCGQSGATARSHQARNGAAPQSLASPIGYPRYFEVRAILIFALYDSANNSKEKRNPARFRAVKNLI